MRLHKTHLPIILLLLFTLCAFDTQANNIQAEKTTDRWVEIDLYWFDKDNIAGSVDVFWQRNSPFFEEIKGWKGVILNVGWVMDYVHDWRGDLSQKIPFPKGMNQDKWFLVEGTLSGDLSEKRKQWRERFSKPADKQKKDYQDWTYGDLKNLAEQIRITADKKYGLKDIKVGSFVLAWKTIYGGSAFDWSTRHPEAYTTMEMMWRCENYDPTTVLKGDTVKYGAFPKGIKEGTPSNQFFASQWGSLSNMVGLDALVLRDGIIGPGVYGRKGPFGGAASPDPAKVAAWSKANADFIKATKLAKPEALIIGYSSAESAVSDWRVNCFDLEAIAKEGYLDAYIDQTWSGAWNEIGARELGDDFWNNAALGWTYQMANMLLHGAVLAETKTRHYHLTETFDAWESWDVIHTVPDRLKWGIWAYSHAAVKTPSGLKMPDGAYISWCNQGTRLLSEADVKFLSKNLDEAYKDAAATTEVFGPTLVYSRDAMEWQSKNKPDQIIKEWIDEYAGSLMKWSMPIFSVTRMEYLSQINTDLPIIQTPVHLKPAHRDYIAKLIDSGKPVAIFGCPVNGIDPKLAGILGIQGIKTDNITKRYARKTIIKDPIGEGVPDLFNVRQSFGINKVSNGAESIYATVDSIPTEGKIELRLVVKESEYGRLNDFANWAEPTLTLKNGDKINLSTLKPVVAWQEWANLETNKNVVRNPIQIGNKSFAHGLGTHAWSEIIYHLPAGLYQKFESYIGMDSESKGKGSSGIFEVYINGKREYESPGIKGGQEALFVSMPIPEKGKESKNAIMSPSLMVNNSKGKKAMFWDPTELLYEVNMPLLNKIGGSVYPYVMVNRILNKYLKETNALHASEIAVDQPLCIGAWKLSNGEYRILAGNLEEGMQFTVDETKQVTMEIPKTWFLGKSFTAKKLWDSNPGALTGNTLKIPLKHTECSLYGLMNK